jgi:hypothetical protein
VINHCTCRKRRYGRAFSRAGVAPSGTTACRQTVAGVTGQPIKKWTSEGRRLAHLHAGRDEGERFVLYAHGEMYGSVTVTQGFSYIGDAVTHPRYMFSRANFSEVAQISPKSGFLRGVCA